MLATAANAGHNATAAAAGLGGRGGEGGCAEPLLESLAERLSRHGAWRGARLVTDDELLSHCLATPVPSGDDDDDALRLYEWHGRPNAIGGAMAAAATAHHRGCGVAGLDDFAADCRQLLGGGRLHSVVRGESGPRVRELVKLLTTRARGPGAPLLRPQSGGQAVPTGQSAAAVHAAHLQHAELLALATALLTVLPPDATAVEVEHALAAHAAGTASVEGGAPILLVVFVSRPCCGCCQHVLQAIAKEYHLSVHVAQSHSKGVLVHWFRRARA